MSLVGLYDPALLAASPPSVGGGDHFFTAYAFLEDRRPTFSVTGYNFHHSFGGGWAASTDEAGQPIAGAASYGARPAYGGRLLITTTNPLPSLAVAGTWISLEGAHNARDLGGLPTPTGATRAGVLFRSDALDQLTPSDVDELHATRGLAHVVDLRSASERAARGRGLLGGTGVRYTELEVIGPDDMQRREQTRRAAFASGLAPAEIMSDGYVELIELGGAAFVEAFTQIVAPGGTPALVHCAAGKDRTGVLVALLLDVAGVDRAEIVADYAATTDRMAAIVARLGGAASYEQIATQYPPFVFEAIAETMERFLAFVDATWGGGGGFFAHYGVSDDDLGRWRDLFVGS